MSIASSSSCFTFRPWRAQKQVDLALARDLGDFVKEKGPVARAMSSLPVPLSPWIKTVASVSATWRTWLNHHHHGPVSRNHDHGDAWVTLCDDLDQFHAVAVTRKSDISDDGVVRGQS